MAASPRNIARQAAIMTYQQVCHDKMNQLRHARFFPDLAACLLYTSDNGQGFPLFQGKADVPQHIHAAETLLNAFYCQYCHVCVLLSP